VNVRISNFLYNESSSFIITKFNVFTLEIDFYIIFIISSLLNIKELNLNWFLKLNNILLFKFPNVSKCIILIQNMWLKK